MVIGHIGISLLQHSLLDADLVPIVAGGLFPDALDKTLCQVMKLTPSGRMWGHTALSVVITTTLVAALAGTRPARDWLLGYTGHLVADGDGPVPWWYPFRTYSFEPSPGFLEMLHRFTDNRRAVAAEFGLLAVGLVAWAARSRRRGR